MLLTTNLNVVQLYYPEESEANFKWGSSVGMSITLLSCLLTCPRLIKLQNHFIGKTTNQNNVT